MRLDDLSHLTWVSTRKDGTQVYTAIVNSAHFKRDLRIVSMASWKIRKANAHLLERFSAYLGLDFNEIKSRPEFEAACHYGAIAAMGLLQHETIRTIDYKKNNSFPLSANKSRISPFLMLNCRSS